MGVIDSEDEVCLAAKNTRRWYLDSGCSRHMSGDKEQFVTLEPKDEGGVVTFGDNGQDKIIEIDKIQITPSTFIDSVLLVKGLKHSLISISQLCDKGLKVSFETSMCIITNLKDDSIIFIDNRHRNIYSIDLNKMSNLSQCLMTNDAKKNDISMP